MSVRYVLRSCRQKIMGFKKISTLTLDNALTQFLAPHGTYPCLLLVASKIARLTDVVADLTARYNWLQLAVGRELSGVLLQEPSRARGRVAERWMQAQTRAAAPDPVLCTEIDLLFTPALSLDPLALFRKAGRLTPLVIAWPGSCRESILTYATPTHQHYRTWKTSAVLIVNVEV